MELFILFCVLNILNVIIQTVKSIATIKCGKVMASVVNAIAYGLYTVVIVYTMCDIALWLKALVVAIANLIGVFVVKLIEEKSRKDKIWKVEMTVKSRLKADVESFLKSANLPYTCVATNTQEHYLINVFCNTQKESLAVKEIVNKFKVRYFVTETKTL